MSLESEPDKIREILASEGDHFRVHDPGTWPAQARLASNGEWELLKEYQAGDDDSLGEILPLVYDELRKIASGLLRGEHVMRTLQATEVVSEAYLRLFDQENLNFENRRHFFGVATIAMRRFLVEYARRRCRPTRAGGWLRAARPAPGRRARPPPPIRRGAG